MTKQSTIHRRLAAAALVLAGAIVGALPPNAAHAADEPRRWDLTELYPTPKAWDQAFAAERERVRALAGLQSGATRDAAALRQTLVPISDAQREVARLGVCASLSGDLYCGIARRYYGEAEGVMKIDPRYCIEWAYVSHFFRDFYVWQYATSMAGAAEFGRAIRREGAPARERFIRPLEAGGSDYAYPLYLKAGVDLARPEPYQALIARMNRLIDEFEQLGPVAPAGR